MWKLSPARGVLILHQVLSNVGNGFFLLLQEHTAGLTLFQQKQAAKHILCMGKNCWLYMQRSLPLQEHTAGLTPFQQKQAAKLILSRICEAYGRMLLLQGLFQADCHPGNILVMKGNILS